MQSDTWRNFQLIKSLAKSEHPFSKFSTGNLDTLGTSPKNEGVDVRKLLIDFHAKYYSANIMRVAVYGSESLDTLQKWVEEKFSLIPDKSLEINRFSSEPYGADELGKIVEIVPVKDVKSVDFFFPLPTVQPLYESKPLDYVAHLIGHESEGSILAHLKTKGWANELGCYTFLSQVDFSAFRINISLTDEGTRRVDDIVSVVFAYIGMMIKEGPKEWIAQENKTTHDMKFRFVDKTDPAEYCTRLAENMHLYKPEHSVSGPHLVYKENLPEVAKFTSMLTPSNCIIAVSDKNFDGKTTQKERWYGTNYNCSRYQAHQSSRWMKAIAHEDSDTDVSALFLPVPNPFLPSDFSICPLSEEWRRTHETFCLVSGPVIITTIDDYSGEGQSPHESDANKSSPVPVHSKGRSLRTWFFQDTKWQVPKVNVYLQLHCHEAYTTPGQVAFTELFANVLTEILAEYSYYADCGGLSYDVRNTNKGLVLIFYGYHDKLGTLMVKTLNEMKNMGDANSPNSPCSEDIFDRLKERLLRQYANSVFAQPYSHCITASLECLEHPRWNNLEKHAALSTLTMMDFKSFCSLLLKSMFAEVFVMGNISPEASQALSLDVIKTLNCEKLVESQFPTRRGVLLECGKNYVYQQNATLFNPDEVNSAIENLYFVGPQCGFTSVDDEPANADMKLESVVHDRDVSRWSPLAMSSTLTLVCHLLEEPAFDQLRTKEQLGYLVHSSGAIVGGRDCLRVIVQSNARDPVYLDQRIESFLKSYFEETLSQLTDDSLLDNKKSCIENLLEKPKNLNRESARYWSEISSGQYFYTRKQKYAEFIASISKEDLVTFFESFLLPQAKNRCKFSSQFFGKEQVIPDNVPEDTVAVSSPTSFKSGLMLKPHISYDSVLDTSHVLDRHNQ